MTHIMLDLETWGRTPGSDIRSIGAVVFDPFKGWIDGVNGDVSFPSGTFYVATDNPVHNGIIGHWDGYSTKRVYPLTRERETVEWWSKQSPEAQAAFSDPVDMKQALQEFTDWLGDQHERNAAYEPTSLRIWANDPHFDVSILDAVFRAAGLPVPWHYRSPRSMKTITEAAGMTSADYSNYGDAHNALDDAIAQAMTVCEAFKRLGLQK